MRAGTFVLVGVSVALALQFAVSMTPGASAQGLFSKGDYWVYVTSSDYGTASMSGMLNVSYIGMSSQTVSGKTYATYDLQYLSSYSWSGMASGSTSVTEHQYIDQVSENTVVDVYNESDSVTFSYPGTTTTLEGWTNNMSVYDPPGGTGTWPSIVSVGDTWTIAYTISYTQEVFNGTSISANSGTIVEEVTYSLVRTETISVPAGTFDCTVMTITSPDYTYTRWYSDKIGNDVKTIGSYGQGDNSTILLADYSYNSSTTTKASAEYVGLGAAVAAASAVLVYLLFTKRTREMGQSVQQDRKLSRPPTPPFY